MADVLPAYVTAYDDRHGKQRFRFRKAGLPSRSLPGEPGSEQFTKAYDEAVIGTRRERRRAGPQPRTLRAAWCEIQQSAEWQQLKASSKTQQIGVAERFLSQAIDGKDDASFGEMPFAGLRRGDVKKILGRYRDTPHAGEAVLRLLRKLSLSALDQEWIEADPTYRIHFRPKLIGHRAWTDAELLTYEAKWHPGTRERLGYALALYTGQRRADVAAMRWAAYDGDGVAVVQEKTGAPLWIPAHPNLKVLLDQAPTHSIAIMTTGFAKPFSTNGFGNMMADAIGDAGLPDACRLHGLRKSAGRCLAEAGATTKQIMAVLGHKTMTEAERYTREADQRRLASAGIEHWAKPKLAVVGK